MPTPTYTPLANITFSSSAASVTFSSISQAYRDLVLVVSTKWSVDNIGGVIRYEYNSDTDNANYTKVYMYGDGSSTYSGTQTTASFPNVGVFGYGSPAPLFMIKSDILDYSAIDKHKSYLNRVDYPGGQTNAMAMRWANSAAISSIAVKSSGGASFASGSTFALYGIAA